ncbi:MAG: GNAT family N-acetyltransferase [Granulosicoccaceae bacterium]
MISTRTLTAADQAHLWHWLHLALWDPPPAGLRPIRVLNEPGTRIYAEHWGRPGDLGLLAQKQGKNIGACWMRCLPESEGLAFVDAQTPQLGISLEEVHRGRGYGEQLMRATLRAAKQAGYRQVSLTVHPENPAQRAYRRCGFESIGTRQHYQLMLVKLPSR